MIANPSPTSAFPVATQTVNLYTAQHPELSEWLDRMRGMLNLFGSLTAQGRGQAAVVCRQAAKVLSYLQESPSLPLQVDVLQYLWQTKVTTRQSFVTFALGATNGQPATGPQALSVLLTPAAASAIQSLNVWDPAAAYAQAPPGNPPGLLLSMAQGISVGNQQSTVQGGPQQAYTTYTILAGDTIQSLAAKFLGSPAQASVLISTNNLRYPYISSSLVERTGSAEAVWLVQAVQVQQSSGLLWTAAITSGATSTSLQGGTPNLGDSLVFESTQGTGYQEVRQVTSISGSTLGWTDPLAYTYGQGSRITLCRTYGAGSQVLGPGDTLLVPLSGTLTASQVLPGGVDQTLGTDLLLDARRALAPLSGVGDLQTASGVANLQQALNVRLNTALGALPLHPGYGVIQADLLSPAPAGLALAEMEIRAVLLQDPRVQGVSNIAVTVSGTVLTYQATILLQGTQSSISLANQLSLTA